MLRASTSSTLHQATKLVSRALRNLRLLGSAVSTRAPEDHVKICHEQHASFEYVQQWTYKYTWHFLEETHGHGHLHQADTLFGLHCQSLSKR